MKTTTQTIEPAKMHLQTAVLDDSFYTPDEVAKILKLKIRTIYDYIKDGKISAYQLGKGYRIKKDDLSVFLGKSRIAFDKRKNKNHSPTVLDLFSGCGGLSYGFEQAGYKILLGVDNWKDALETFARNHADAKTYLADLSKMSPREFGRRYGIAKDGVDVIVGGPPCQGFSIAGKREIEDPRNRLYKAFVQCVGYFEPKAFLLENVPNLVALGEGKIRDQIISDFEHLGYKVAWKVLRASDYGVPQHRKRVVFVGLRNGRLFEFPKPTHGDGALPFVTAKEALNDLPEHDLEEGSQYVNDVSSYYQSQMRSESPGLFNHQITAHKPETIMTIAAVPDGGNYKNLPEELRGKRNVHIAWTRLNSSRPSFTIDTGHRHHFHYSFNRIPTVRESARLQSFPDAFVFTGTKTSQYKQVGNAVPPLLAKALAGNLLSFI